jgi:hypothetical protein
LVPPMRLRLEVTLVVLLVVFGAEVGWLMADPPT